MSLFCWDMLNIFLDVHFLDQWVPQKQKQIIKSIFNDSYILGLGPVLKNCPSVTALFFESCFPWKGQKVHCTIYNHNRWNGDTAWQLRPRHHERQKNWCSSSVFAVRSIKNIWHSMPVILNFRRPLTCPKVLYILRLKLNLQMDAQSAK